MAGQSCATWSYPVTALLSFLSYRGVAADTTGRGLGLGCAGNKVADDGAVHIGQALLGCTNLQRLIMPSTWCTSVCDTLDFIARSCPASDNDIGDKGAKALATALGKCQDLRHVNLAGTVGAAPAVANLSS